MRRLALVFALSLGIGLLLPVAVEANGRQFRSHGHHGFHHHGFHHHGFQHRGFHHRGFPGFHSHRGIIVAPIPLVVPPVVIAPPVVVAPGPVWVPGHWGWTGYTWVWVSGYWAYH